MNSRNLWAYISSVTAVFLTTVILGFSVALPAGAQNLKNQPILWEYTSRAPYEGTIEAVSILQEQKSGLPRTEFMRGVAMLDESKCDTSFFKDGDYFWNSFTSANGVSNVIWTMVALKYAAGDEVNGQPLLKGDPLVGTPLPPLHEKRRMLICPLGREDGAAVVYPFACSNWGVMYGVPTKMVAKVLDPTEQVVKPPVQSKLPAVKKAPLCANAGSIDMGSIHDPGYIVPIQTITSHGYYAFGTFGVVPSSTMHISSWQGCQQLTTHKE